MISWKLGAGFEPVLLLPYLAFQLGEEGGGSLYLGLKASHTIASQNWAMKSIV